MSLSLRSTRTPPQLAKRHHGITVSHSDSGCHWQPERPPECQHGWGGPGPCTVTIMITSYRPPPRQAVCRRALSTVTVMATGGRTTQSQARTQDHWHDTQNRTPRLRPPAMMVRARAPPVRPGPRKVARLAGREWPQAAALRPRRTPAGGGGPQSRTVTSTTRGTFTPLTLTAHWHAVLPIGQVLYWPEAPPASPTGRLRRSRSWQQSFKFISDPESVPACRGNPRARPALQIHLRPGPGPGTVTD